MYDLDRRTAAGILGLDADAGRAAAKAAYLKLVRVHTPENDPGAFRRIAAAYRVLSDPRHVDRPKQLPEIPDDLWSDVDSALRDLVAAPRMAVQKLRKLHWNHADVPGLKIFLAMALLELEEHEATDRSQARALVEEAITILESLDRAHPQTPDVLQWLGFAMLKTGPRQQEAEPALRRALELDPHDDTPLLMLVAHHVSRDNTVVVKRLVQEGIERHAEVPFRSLPYRLQGLRIHAEADETSRFDQDLSDVVALIPPGDTEAKAFVQSELLEVAFVLLESHPTASKTICTRVKSLGIASETVQSSMDFVEELVREKLPGPVSGCFQVIRTVVVLLGLIVLALKACGSGDSGYY